MTTSPVILDVRPLAFVAPGHPSAVALGKACWTRPDPADESRVDLRAEWVLLVPLGGVLVPVVAAPWDREAARFAASGKVEVRHDRA